jgi:hypothetical protein
MIGDRVLLLRRAAVTNEQLLCFFNFSEEQVSYCYNATPTDVNILDSHGARWSTGPNNALLAATRLYPYAQMNLSPLSIVVYHVTQTPG